MMLLAGANSSGYYTRRGQCRHYKRWPIAAGDGPLNKCSSSKGAATEGAPVFRKRYGRGNSGSNTVSDAGPQPSVSGLTSGGQGQSVILVVVALIMATQWEPNC